MTGYARVRRATPAGEVTFALKSVNHRGLDLHFHLPASLEPYEAALRERLRKRLTRGHVELRGSLDRASSETSVAINFALLDAYVAAVSAAAKRHGVAVEPDLNAALRLPGMFAPAESTFEDLESALLAILEEAVTQLNDFRAREGSELREEMLNRQRRIVELAASVDSLRDDASRALRNRLEQRLAEIAVRLEPQRLAQEAAVLADKSDIAEEIARLRIHAAQLGDLLAAGGECGKKIDFLLQELSRETNTMLAKTANAGEPGLRVSEIALAIKAELEKIREQALNVE
jgi:uncharacterized protein (TIGR00255 family)